jgi:hypothetical protein
VILAFSVRCQLVPDHTSGCAIEESPEHEDRVEDGGCDDRPPRTVEHGSIERTTWSKETQVLKEDCDLHKTYGGTVDDFPSIGPLVSVSKVQYQLQRRLTYSKWKS